MTRLGILKISVLLALVLILSASGTNLSINNGFPAAEGDSNTGFAQQEGEWINWASLKNPILTRDDACLKNAAVVYDNGYFYLFISRWTYRTRDFKTYEELPFFDNAGSPNIIKHGDTWYVVFQSRPSPDSTARKLYYSTSRDLLHWTDPIYLETDEETPKKREIDGTLAVANDRLILGYKADQKFYVTSSLDSIESPASVEWMKPRRAYAGEGFWPFKETTTWAEDFQFIEIDGKWKMIATGMLYGIPAIEYTWGHEPYLYEMKSGSEENLADWTEWTSKRLIEIPYEGWNMVMHANSAFLCDWREYDGYFYLFYAGANDFWSFNRRGYGKIGIARSRDLVSWEVPGGAKENVLYSIAGNSIVLLMFSLITVVPAIVLILVIFVLVRRLKRRQMPN